MGLYTTTEQSAAPSTPASGSSVLYPKTDGLWYWKDDSGVEHAIVGDGSEITGATLNNAVAKGTWTASGTWTLPALTLGGNVTQGTKYISYGGTDAGLSFDSSNNATFSAGVTGGAGSFTTLSASGVVNTTAGSAASSYRLSGWDGLSYTGTNLQVGNAFSAGTQWTEISSYIANSKVTSVTSTGLAVTGALSATTSITAGPTVSGAVGATNKFYSDNSTDANAVEIRQGRFNKDNLILSTNQTTSGYFLRVNENGSDVLTVGTGGTVNIGGALPVNNGVLGVKSSSGQSARFYNSAGDSTPAVAIDKSSATDTTSQVFMMFTVNAQTTGAGQINGNGASQAAFGSFSDRRLKENIVDLSPQLGNILALRPVEFDYIEPEGGGHQISFIAQEFAQVYPDAVGERPDGMKTLTGWGKTEARMVKAMQELNAEVQSLRSRVALLEQ